MATAGVRLKGTKWQVRWRVGGGSGPQTYLSFDDEETARYAARIVDVAKCNIKSENVLAIIENVSPEEVAGLRAEVNRTKSDSSPRMTVREAVEPYLKSLVLTTESGTREKYAMLLGIAWLPKIGDMQISAVTDEHIRDIMAAMSRCDCTAEAWGFWCGRRKGNARLRPSMPHQPGVTKRTQDRYYSAIRGLFYFAVRKKLLSSSAVVSAGYKPQSLAKYNSGTTKESEHFYMTEEQFALVRSKLPTRIQVLFDLMGETGLRYSEATGLKVRQFTNSAKPLIVLDEVIKHSKSRGHYRGAPKSGASRTLRISTSMALKLANAIAGKSEDDLIFTSARGHLLTARNFRRDIWDPAVVAAQRCPEHPPEIQVRKVEPDDLSGPRCGDNGGRNARGRLCKALVVAGTDRCAAHLGIAREAVSTCECTDPKFPRRISRPLTPHDLRHTYTAWMIKKRHHSIVIAKRLGNSPEVMQGVYAGILDEVDDEIAQDSAILF